MIQAVPATKPPSVPTASRGVPSPKRFALSLAAVSSGGDGADSDDDAAVTTAAKDGNTRQDTADDGTDLPSDDAPVDPRLAWLALPVAVPVTPAVAGSADPATAVVVAAPAGKTAAVATTVPTPAAPGVPPAAATPTPPLPTAAGAPPPLQPGSPPVVPAAAALPVATPPVPDGAAVATLSPDPTTPPAAQPVAVPDAPTAPAAGSLAAPLPIALPDPTRPASATSALQAFAGAMRAGWKQEERSAKADGPDPLAPAGAQTLTPLESMRPAVAATGAAQDQTLDTRREHWPATMIDHIEALRDAADATSSKIRVVPDALGTIDLSVKRDGDTLHVHFSAEQAATRTMLADAQPRLAEIAQSRGLRLGDTNVGGGGSGAPQHRAPSPILPIAPVSALPRATAAAVATDTRIA